MYAFEYVSPTKSPLYHARLFISNSTFYHHFPKTAESQSRNSVIGFIDIPYVGLESITILHSGCTAISATQTTLHVSGQSVISNNTAVTGAGILLDTSTVLFDPESFLAVTNNSAERKGGGIFIAEDLSCPPFYTDYDGCTIQFVILEAGVNSLVIANNSAPDGGDNVFGRIDKCEDVIFAFDVVHVPNNTAIKPSSMSSNPLKVCLSAPKEKECTTHLTRTILPGQVIIFPLRLVGIYNGSVPGTVSAKTTEGAVINPNEDAQVVSILGGNVTYTISSSQAKSISTANLTLQPVDSSCDSRQVSAISFSTVRLDLTILRSSPKCFNATAVTQAQ